MMAPARYTATCLSALCIFLAASPNTVHASANANDDRARVEKLVSLSKFLADFARRSGVRLIYESRITRNVAIAERDSPVEDLDALSDMLRPLDIELHAVSPSTYALSAVSAKPEMPSLPSVAVTTNDATASLIDTILVTARAASASLDLSSPNLISLDRDHALLFDIASPADAIEELPGAVASFTPANTGFRGASGGVYFPDLNGFRPERTLVLVNGRRRTMTPGGTNIRAGVDLNAIAEPFLERIEIVNGANGAQFGDEAVGGVINFVLRTDVDGIETGARASVAERGDAVERSIYILGGTKTKSDTARATAGFYYSDTDGLLGGDRIEDGAYGFAAAGVQGFAPDAAFLPGFGGSRITPSGALVGARLQDGSIVSLPGGAQLLTGAGGIEPFAGRRDQLYDWTGDSHFIAPVRRMIATFDGSIDLGNRISAFTAVSFADTRSIISAAPLPGSFASGVDADIGNAIAVDLDHPTIPDAIRDFYDDAFGGAAQSIVIERRFVALGARWQDVSRRYFDATTGLDFQVSEFLDIGVAYRFGRSAVDDARINIADRLRLETALQPDLCSATPSCVEVDPFAAPISPEAAEYLRAPPILRSLALNEHDIDIHANFKLGRDGNKAVRGALSARFEWERYKDYAEFSLSNFIGVNVNNNTSGALRRSRFAGRFDIPVGAILSEAASFDVTLASSLHTSPAYRSFANVQAVASWKPAPPLTIHGQFYSGRRAPNAIELFDTPQSFFRGVIDPCDAANGSFSGVVAENCLAVGPLSVEPGHRQSGDLVILNGFGDPNLEPERVRDVSAGLAYANDAAFAESLSLNVSATWRQTTVRDMIVGFSDALSDCYESPNLVSPACGDDPLTGAPLIRRNPVTRQVEAMTILLTNRGDLRRESINFDAGVAWEPPDSVISRLWLTATHTYLLNAMYTEQETGDFENTLANLDNPAHRTLVTGGVDTGAVVATATWNRRSKVRTSDIEHPAAIIGAYGTLDVSTKFRVGDGLSLTAGVKNLADRRSPIAAFGNHGGYFPQYYDFTGRRFSLSFRAKF